MANPRKLTIPAIKAICLRIAEGKSVQASLELEGWKSRRAFHQFLMDNPEAREIYKTAVSVRAEGWAEELIDIADDGTRDTVTVERNGRTEEVVNHDHIKRSALRIDTRKWLISKHLPKTYGDKMQLVGDGGGPVEHIVKGMTDEDLDARIRQLLPEAGIDPAS